MALKKVKFETDEEAIFDEAVIYKRGEYWQMRMWLVGFAITFYVLALRS